MLRILRVIALVLLCTFMLLFLLAFGVWVFHFQKARHGIMSIALLHSILATAPVAVLFYYFLEGLFDFDIDDILDWILDKCKKRE